MRTKLIISGLIVTLAATGCSNMPQMSDTQRGTATGAGVGALAGAALGAATGGGGGRRAATGAVLGGLAGAAVGNIWSSKMENQKRVMQQATQGTGVQVTQTADNRLKVEIPSDISFATGRADISPNLRSILDRFAASLNDNPGTTVTIIGHTDNTGTDAINDPLSRNRAASVRDYLTARGVASNRIMIDGRGSREPLVENNSAANRAKNRRVEIFVAEKAQQSAPQASPQYGPAPQYGTVPQQYGPR